MDDGRIVPGADVNGRLSPYGDRIMTRIIYLTVLLVGLLVAPLCALVAAPIRPRPSAAGCA